MQKLERKTKEMFLINSNLDQSDHFDIEIVLGKTISYDFKYKVPKWGKCLTM